MNQNTDFYKDVFRYTLVRIEGDGDNKTLVLVNGKRIKILEKHYPHYDGCINIEEYSDKHTKKVGWLGRDNDIDYIVVSVLDKKLKFIFPFHILQKIWVDNYRKWLLAFGQKEDELQHTYIPIPINELLSALNKAMCSSPYENNYSKEIIKQQAIDFVKGIDEFMEEYAEGFELKNFNDETKELITKGFALMSIDRILSITKEHHSYWVSIKKEIGEI